MGSKDQVSLTLPGATLAICGVPRKVTNTKKGRAKQREEDIEPLDPAIPDLLPRLLDS